MVTILLIKENKIPVRLMADGCNGKQTYVCDLAT